MCFERLGGRGDGRLKMLLCLKDVDCDGIILMGGKTLMLMCLRVEYVSIYFRGA